ncbi:MAG: NADH-quinone oxidoreductase subunit G [Candidatus Nanopelagicales bacterium]
MTITNEPRADVAVPTELVTVIIDGVAVGVPKGTLVIRAAEMLGIEIPRFCDHPLLEPVAACRACLIEIDGVPKPQPACAQVVSDGMQVHTQYSSEVARLAQEGVMEFLLLNHPLDCPVCDKGGECPLQNQAMSVGRPESRFTEVKRTFEKPINVSAQILLDRERCVSCARCTRFADQIAGDPMLELLERGALQQVGTADDEPFDSYFSGNTIQICPVGALTSATYRFRARPFDLVSVPTSCEHCASGCALRTDYRRSTVTRRLAWDDPQVNEEWNCDKGRFAFAYQQQGRIEWPLVRENGELRSASWPEALSIAAHGLQSAGKDTAVLVGGRSTMEDAYAYSRFARVALGTDNIDFRARVNSEEEREFLAAHIAGTPIRVEYADLETAPIVLLVAFEPEDESPIVFLRLRKAAANGVAIASVAAGATRGLAKMNGTLVPAVPGLEAHALANLPQDIRAALAQPGAVIMLGERTAAAPGALTVAAELAQQTGAALAWVPRRAGERGALDAGALAGLLPGGRPLTDPQAREEVAGIWGVSAADLPQSGLAGLPLHDAVDAGRIRGALVGGVEPSDYPLDAIEALGKVDFIVSLENHHSAVTEMADVVLPVGVVTEKSGTFLDWEGRPRPFGQVFRDAMMGSDASVLAMLADAMGHPLPGSVNELRAQMGRLGRWTGARTTMSGSPATVPATVASDGVRLETWRLLLDLGVMQEGDPHLAATARPTVARMSAATARAHDISDSATVHGPTGSITVPVEIDDSMVDSVVWLPMNSEGSRVYRDLGAGHGAAVRVSAGGRP